MTQEDRTEIAKRDLIGVLLGELLGSGVARETFSLRFSPDLVAKIEDGVQSFQNISEWNTWNDIKESRWGKYLAPCELISACGCVLIQKRCTPLTPDMETVKLPNFLTDFKRSNYGIYEGRVVCMDYGLTFLSEMAADNEKIRLIKPEYQ